MANPRSMPQPPRLQSTGRSAVRTLRRAQAVVPEQLERHLLRRTVGILSDDRTRCADCGRAPLIGEQVHIYAADQLVCDLCRSLRHGPPDSSERVRHGAAGEMVKVTRRAGGVVTPSS